MNAEFFALAFLAGLNPKLLALDLLLIENRRPRAMFSWLLVGGLTVGVTIGLLDVLVFHLDAINHQGSVSARHRCWSGTGSRRSGNRRKRRAAGRSDCWPSLGSVSPCSSAR